MRDLLGHSPTSPDLAAFLSALSSPIATPDVKSYPDAVYFNYYSLGLSLLFLPIDGYKPRSEISHLALDGIDVYNDLFSVKPDDKKGLRSPAYSPYPVTPITLAVTPETKEGTPRPSTLSITRNMTGKEFVTALGEPDRKGGGSGPSSGNIGIWVEWTRDGLMVEFGGDDSRGPQAWERGKDAPWRVISIFSSKVK